jgi:uncharacterized protein YdhG (YjbR/CyaY superfamily)
VAQPAWKSVDDYLQAQPPAVAAVLRRVRGILRKTLPRAEEVISYQIPAYRQDGLMVLYFSGWKEHYSIYPASARVVDTLGDEVKRHVHSKGTLRFSYVEAVPEKLIARIAQLRLQDNAERRAAQAARKARKKPARALQAQRRAASAVKPAKRAAAKTSVKQRPGTAPTKRAPAKKRATSKKR